MDIQVLVVEDEETVRTVFARVLQEDGYIVSEAGSGEDALEQFQTRRHQIVVADIRMGGMSGLQLLEEVKAISADTQVIIISSHASTDLTIHALRAGAYDYLIKPVDSLDLISNVVQRAAEKVRLMAQNQSLILDLKVANKKLEMKNQELYYLATRDGLTGLHNYRYFRESLSQQIFQAKRQAISVSLVFIDIDYFKKFNDTNGHPMGDALLKTFSKILQDRIREVDIVCRYGGEEFVIVLPNTDRPGALVLAENIRMVVGDHPFPGRENMPHGRVSASFGIATYPMDGDDEEALILHADQALYRAKHNGRNSVY